MSASGKWNITIDSPMGSQNGTLDLTVTGNAVSGSMSGPQGVINLTDGTANGDNLTWKANMTSPMAITLAFTATVAGDKISGSIELGSFGSASFSGSKA